MPVNNSKELFEQIATQASDYVEMQGREMANDALQAISKKIEKNVIKKIGDKDIRELASHELKSISNVDGMIEAVGSVEEIKEFIEKYINGETTRGEVIENISDKAAVFVSSAVERIATGLAAAKGSGSFAPAIGAAAGYVAGNIFREAVAPIVNAAKRANQSRKQYEFLHGMYEESIRQMQERRIQFEEETLALFTNRKELIDSCFSQLDSAVKSRNVNKASSALNQIAQEFGSELKFKTLEEFDDFISNSNEELVL